MRPKVQKCILGLLREKEECVQRANRVLWRVSVHTKMAVPPDWLNGRSKAP